MSDDPEADEKLVNARLIGKVRRTLGRVSFARDAVAAFFAARDPATPRGVKIMVMGALAYFVMPADMVPDFIAGLGYTDDATVFLMAWRALAPHLKDEHREKAARLLAPEGGEGH